MEISASDANEIERLKNSTIRRVKGPTILLGSGSYFDYEDPEHSDTSLEDVAYGLGYEGRFAGQYVSKILGRRAFYSSGQHSVLASIAAKAGLELQALWHEAGEMPCGDATGPLKSLIPNYKAIEKRCEAAIMAKFGIAITDPLEIKKLDIRMLMTERRDMEQWRGEAWSSDDGALEPFSFHIIPWTPDQSALAFIERHFELTRPSFRSEFLAKLIDEAMSGIPFLPRAI